MFKELILQLVQSFAKIVGYIPALVYGYIYSEYFTK